jgi:hypothetical protein
MSIDIAVHLVMRIIIAHDMNICKKNKLSIVFLHHLLRRLKKKLVLSRKGCYGYLV